MTRFLNPYHFIPVQSKLSTRSRGVDRDRPWEEQLGHIAHDRYHAETKSGRIICRLETATPTVIGGNQEKLEDESTRIHPFKRNDQPAIPGTTLRGLISSLAEAASNSALRILTDNRYSRRAEVREVGARIEDHSALGLIVEKEGALYLRPLAAPFISMELRADDHDHARFLPPGYRKMFPQKYPPLRVFREKRFFESLPSHSANNPKCLVLENVNFSYKIKEFRNKKILMGLFVGPGRGSYRVIPRVMYTDNRSEEILTNKYEYFLFYPKGIEKKLDIGTDIFPIEPEALDRLERLARERGEAENEKRRKKGKDPLPFALKGAVPFEKRDYRLADQDIVFFRPNQAGDRVEEVWVSQIWRKEVPRTTHGFFRSINPELLPFNKDRKQLTPAEALFGFVEVNPKTEKNEAPEEGEDRPPSLALAGRVRFHDAVFGGCPNGGPFLQEVPLKILASPKPPCPSFYFNNTKDRSGSYISKMELDDHPEDYWPKGRKQYWSFQGHYEGDKENLKQKCRVTPLMAGCRFYFYLDFENLTEWEVGLLLYALQPAAPSWDFHHKIGLGKPLGLGSIRIQVCSVRLIDRTRRYAQDDPFASRYHRVWENPPEETDEYEEYLIRIRENGMESTEPAEWLAEAGQCFTRDMDPAIREAIEKMGREVEDHPVSYPVTRDQQPGAETENFKWFQNNDRSKADQQGLKPLDALKDDELPLLRTN
ncbi:MAG: TIGR03986 family CRISPR-associated RAMP protein [Proteobacteria bacterium]|nr:TIGR03986 family CRISPR-associated RAMP protein [Pseudomonadota bacterium]